MKIEGMITAMVTPFDDDFSLSEKRTENLTRFLIENGSQGLFVLGTNGEFFSLSREEKVKQVKYVKKYSEGKIPLYAGAGGLSTYESIETAKALEEAGADGISVINPFFNKLKDEEIVNHYRHIAKAVNIPLLIYNMPGNTGMNISENIFKGLIEIENIKGIKDSSGDMENVKNYIALSKDKDFSVLIGSDSKILSGLKLGAKGCVASTSNVITRHVVNLLEAFKEGRMEEAEKLQKDIDVIRAAFKLGTQPSVVKRALYLLGIDVGNTRLPILMPEGKDEEIKEMLSFYKLI